MLTSEERVAIENLKLACTSADQIQQNLRQAELLHEQIEVKLGELREERANIERLVKESTLCFPWLASALGKYYEACDLKIAVYLSEKIRPSLKSAETVRLLAAEKRQLQESLTLALGRIEYYESLFPHLSDYVADDIADLVKHVPKSRDDVDDEVRQWLPEAEYTRLATQERNQLALDRWKTSRKAPWEIGRIYERYIGYRHELLGFTVEYRGALDGLADFGRDLIATKDGTVQIIQCKYWSQAKTIREKHIFQLFGTTVEWMLKNRLQKAAHQIDLFPDLLRTQNVRPAFFTTTTLSTEAADFAKTLGVVAHELIPLDMAYPMIKCNWSKRTSERIYHLPFDQQYDRTQIQDETNECYASTVQEAERKGYRRAKRWRGFSA